MGGVRIYAHSPDSICLESGDGTPRQSSGTRRNAPIILYESVGHIVTSEMQNGRLVGTQPNPQIDHNTTFDPCVGSLAPKPLRIPFLCTIGLAVALSACRPQNSYVEESPEVEIFPYEKRVFRLEQKVPNSRIDLSLLEKISNAGEHNEIEALLSRFIEPIEGEATVYLYRADFHIPSNLDGTEGWYGEELMVEVAPDGSISEAFLYCGSSSGVPFHWGLFRAVEPKLKVENLARLSQLTLACPFKSFVSSYDGSDAEIRDNQEI